MQGVAVVSGFGVILGQLPQYLVLLGGAIVALARWRRHPQASLLVLIGVGVLFFDSLASDVLNAALPLVAASRALRFGYSRLGNVLGACRVVFSVIAAIGYGLLLAAAFAGRAPQPAVEKES